MLWQPLITKTNDHTSSKSLKLDIRWEVHKRTRQGVSAKLESYIYRIHMVHATLLQLKDLSVGQWEEPCIGFTQENSIENSVQDGLPYIQIPNSLCELFLTYPKRLCVCLKINMCFTCCMMSSFQNLLPPSMCHVTCDCVI